MGSTAIERCLSRDQLDNNKERNEIHTFRLFQALMSERQKVPFLTGMRSTC